MEQEIVTAAKTDWRKTVSTIGTSLALLSVIIAMIFVFLIGFEVNDKSLLTLAESVSYNSLNDSVSIYDYFGKIYKQLELSEMGSMPDKAAAYYIPAILCTLISAGAFVSVITLGAISISKLLRKLAGKETAKGEKFAFGAIMAYFIGAATLKVFNHFSSNIYYLDISSNGELIKLSFNVVLTYNAATVAGIVLCAMCIAGSIGCRIALNAPFYKENKNLLHTVFSVVSIVFASIIVCFATCSPITSAVRSGSSTKAYLAMPTITLLQNYVSAISDNMIDGDELYGRIVVMILLILFQFAVLALAFTSITNQVSNVFNNKLKSSLNDNAALLTVSAVYLILMIVYVCTYSLDLYGNSDIEFTPCIAALIAAIFNLCTSVARKLITGKSHMIAAENLNS